MNREDIDIKFRQGLIELYSTSVHHEHRVRWVLQDFKPRVDGQKLSKEQELFRLYMDYWGDFSTSECTVKDFNYLSGRCLVYIYQKPNQRSIAFKDGETPTPYPLGIYIHRDSLQDFINFCNFKSENVKKECGLSCFSGNTAEP